MGDEKWLKEAIDRLDGKVDRLDQRLDSVDQTLIKQHEQLKLHIMRTDIAEKNLDSLRGEFKPVQSHVVMIQGALKALGVLSLVVGIVTGLLKLLPYLNF